MIPKIKEELKNDFEILEFRSSVHDFINNTHTFSPKEIYEFDIKNISVIVPSEKKQEEIAKRFIENTKKHLELKKQITDTKEILDRIEEDIWE